MRHARRQYTIRSVPERVDRVLRRRAKETGKSFNQVALEALIEGTGERVQVYDDLDFVIGSLEPRDAEALNRELDAQRHIDADLWK